MKVLKLTYRNVINNTASRTILECTRSYTTENSKYPPVTYIKGQLYPRNLIFLNPANWRIACKTKADKYWKEKDKQLALC